jgi:hypothetical protein
MTQKPRPNIVSDEGCPFCLSRVPRETAQKHAGDSIVVACPCCGRYRISGTAIDVLPRWDLRTSKWAAIAYAVKRMTNRENPPLLTLDVLQALKETAQLAHPDQILDDFVLWAGSHSRWPGDAVDITYLKHRTLLGAVDPAAFNYMLTCIEQSKLFAGKVERSSLVDDVYMQCSLNPLGWERYRELSTVRTASRYGFMAMKYSDPELDAIVRDHFAPQVKLTGFELKRLDQGQGAGLIDDQLRLGIRQARFLVCDLTHGNRGAYWEAGYAEGLGVPVIYTCRHDVFSDPNHKHHPHFDAAHWVTVPWDPVEPGSAAIKLKITVRATLPGEAQLQD